jgi:hypothetical protein
LNLWPGTSFVADQRLGIQKSPAASAGLLHPGEGHVKEIRYCDSGNVILGVTDDGRLIAWKRSDEQINRSSAYVRLAFRDGQGGFSEPSIACVGQILVSTTPSGKYGNLQLWDVIEGELTQHFKFERFTFTKGIATDRAGTIVAIPSVTGVTVWKMNEGGMALLGCISTVFKNGNKRGYDPLQRVSISDDGTTLAVADDENVTLLDLPNLTKERQIGMGKKVRLSISHLTTDMEMQ